MISAIEAERDELVSLARGLIAIPSPNPPGDVSRVSAFAADWLRAAGLDVEVIEPVPGRKNLVASVDSGRPGRHLVMNAHLDVFPVEDESAWTVDPYAGELRDGCIYGRGAIDMKGGAAVFMLLLRALAREARDLAGRATLLLVCDEESFGEHGSRHLLEQRPDLLGDALLSTEPSGAQLIRRGERGLVWSRCKFRSAGGHAAYPAGGRSAIEAACAFLADLPGALRLTADPSRVVAEDMVARYEELLGAGAATAAGSVTVGAGRIAGGARVNMRSALCTVEVDARLPPGVTTARIEELLVGAAAAHGGDVEVFNRSEPNVSDTSDDLFRALIANVERVTSVPPLVAVGLGCTDARLWRHRGVPAAIYGPPPSGMGGIDEHVRVEDLLTMARVHALTAHDLLAAGA